MVEKTLDLGMGLSLAGPGYCFTKILFNYLSFITCSIRGPNIQLHIKKKYRITTIILSSECPSPQLRRQSFPSTFRRLSEQNLPQPPSSSARPDLSH